jgi:hypothetical protein
MAATGIVAATAIVVATVIVADSPDAEPMAAAFAPMAAHPVDTQVVVT